MTKKVKALKDPYYRREQKAEAENPAGEVQLQDEQLEEASGGKGGGKAVLRASIRYCAKAGHAVYASVEHNCAGRAWGWLKRHKPW